MTIIRYGSWSNRPRGATRTSHPIGATVGITAHWEGPRMGSFPHDRCASKVRAIQAFHRDTRGWADIAYNALVCPHGDVFEGRGPGVKSAANGDSATNSAWYAVCYLGGEGDAFTEQGKAGFLEAFDWLTREGDAGPARNGHRDHKATACPGDTIYRWVHSLKPGAAAAPQEDDMSAKAEEQIDWIYKRLQGVTPEPSEKVTRWDGKVVPAKLLDEADGATIMAAIKGLARGLGPTVEKAVTDALAEAVVQVDVNVNKD